MGQPEIPDTDKRTPTISVALNDTEKAQLQQASKRIDDANAVLQQAESEQGSLKQSIIRKHRTAEMKEGFCNEAGYQAAIIRGFVVYTLGITVCHGL